MTVAIGRKRVSRPWEDFLRPLHQAIKGVILSEVWGEGCDSFGKSWTGTKPRGVCACPFSLWFLPECVCVQRGEVARLDLESAHLL